MKGFFSFRAQVVKLMKITQIKCFENLGIAISHSSNLFVYISDNHGKYPLTVIGYAETDLYGDTSLGTHFGTIRGHFDRLFKLQFQQTAQELSIHVLHNATTEWADNYHDILYHNKSALSYRLDHR